MKLSGKEQKLQALFSELKAAEEQSVPRFATVWHRAQVAPRRVSPFSPLFVAVAALIVCALISLAVWSRYQPTPKQTSVVKNEAAPTPPEGVTIVPQTPKPSVTNHQPRDMPLKARGGKSAIRRNAQLALANQKLRRDAKSISNWQSPTSALLTSPGDELFSSLPQFSESTTDLKTFLPNRPN